MEDLLDDSDAREKYLVEIKDNSARAKNTIYAFAGVIIIGLYSTYLQYDQSVVINEMVQGKLPTIEELESKTESINRVSYVSGALGLALIILFLMWMRRAYANINRAGIKTSSSDDVTIWCWFVPIYNFVKPVSLIIEIWEKTKSTVTEITPDTELKKTNKLILFWWVFYAVSIILAFYAGYSHFHAAQVIDYPGIVEAINYSIYSSVFSLLSALLGIIMIRNINEAEQIIFNKKGPLIE